MLLKGGAVGVMLALAVTWAGAQPLPEPTPNPDRSTETGPFAPPLAPSAAQPVRTWAVSPTGIPVVLGARVGEERDRTRFVIELSDPLALRVFTLANPDRVVIDMPEVLWRLQNPERPNGTGAVRSYRYGLFRPGDSRFVIDLNRPVSAAEPMILPPENGYGYRVVLDLFPTSQAKFEVAAGWPADLRAKEAAAERVASIPSAPAAATSPVPLQLLTLAPAPPPPGPALSSSTPAMGALIRVRSASMAC